MEGSCPPPLARKHYGLFLKLLQKMIRRSSSTSSSVCSTGFRRSGSAPDMLITTLGSERNHDEVVTCHVASPLRDKSRLAGVTEKRLEIALAKGGWKSIAWVRKCGSDIVWVPHGDNKVYLVHSMSRRKTSAALMTNWAVFEADFNHISILLCKSCCRHPLRVVRKLIV